MIETWQEAFRGDAEKAIADLFSGRAGVGSGLRLDWPELLHQLFQNETEAQRARLDQALFNWLCGMRRDYALQARRIGFAVYGKRLCDGLVTLQLLDLPDARRRIREELDVWLRWLVPLRLAPERDPALECWRYLTRGQPDTRHLAAWLRLADDPRSEYLPVALAGLERLPNDDPRKNQSLMLRALLQHAVSTNRTSNGARAFFNRRFAALRGLHGPYPRGPQHWQENLLLALDLFARGAKSKKEQELVEQLRAEADKKKLRPQTPRRRASTSPPASREQVEKLVTEIDGSQASLDTLSKRVFGIVEQDYRHAESTGNSYFFTHRLRLLGRRLLKRRGLSTDALTRLAFMIERALGWEPNNFLLWMLWGDWFKYQGAEDSREWTLREIARLFPDHEHSRVELARLLARRGDNQEAEKWLLAAANIDPNKAASRVELARLLIRRGEDKEAEKWLREAATRNPTSKHSRVELARLLITWGEDYWNEAEAWLREAANIEPNDEPARVELARLLIRRGEKKEAEKWLREAVTRSPIHKHSRVELARLLIPQGEDHWGEAEALLRETVKTDPNDAPAHVELARLLILRGEDHWNEAEKHLRGVMARNSDETASRVVLAALLRRRGQTVESQELVRSLHATHPANLETQKAITHVVDAFDITATADLMDDVRTDASESRDIEDEPTGTDEEPGAALLSAEESAIPADEEFAAREEEAIAFSDEKPIPHPGELAAQEPGKRREKKEAVAAGTYISPVEAITPIPAAQFKQEQPQQLTVRDEVARRGSLAAEFSRARIAIAQKHAPKIRRIEQEAAGGDSLAGFYQQWLMPTSSPPPPPHAWAWNACQRWQTSAPSDEWKSLEGQFPELGSETNFLGLLRNSNDDDLENGIAGWLAGSGMDAQTLSSPRFNFMRKSLDRLAETNQAEREEIALAVMASAAVSGLEFAS